MKIHSTNYEDTFILIADDCPIAMGQVPPTKGEAKSIATMQFEMVSQNPYQFTSDDVFFQVFADRKDLTEGERPEARQEFFSKGQPCFRASPLARRYGWGVHSDSQGRIAIYGCETEEYARLAADPNLKIVKAMKGSR
ncbi:MAG: DUF6157 family protein [Bacteroidia bacterium]